MHLEAVLGELGVDGSGVLGRVGNSLSLALEDGLLALEEGGTTGGALGLELLDEALVLPADGGSEVTEAAVLAVSLELEDSEGGGDDDLLDLVVGGGATLEATVVGEGKSTTGGLVGHHATDGAPEDLGGGTEVIRTTAGVGVHALAQVVSPEHLVAEEGTRDVDLLSADAHDLVAVEELLGEHTGQATEKVALAINNDDLK